MGVSANTLFHFTREESLKKILQSRFFITSYSLEHFQDILPSTSIYRKAYVPLISFCDLTITQLSQISRHTSDFGRYGIGLKKDWGEKSGVSPVVYVHSKSYPSESIYSLLRLFNNRSKVGKEGEFNSAIRNQLIGFFKFVKPYKGHWQKNKRFDDPIKYYDEREWRYCPSNEKFKVFAGSPNNKKRTNKLKKELLDEGKLKFAPDDVKFIIIDKQGDIEGFFNVIDRMQISKKGKIELKTKIITFDEIREDF
jgi:hypothetical protein